MNLFFVIQDYLDLFSIKQLDMFSLIGYQKSSDRIQQFCFRAKHLANILINKCHPSNIFLLENLTNLESGR